MASIKIQWTGPMVLDVRMVLLPAADLERWTTRKTADQSNLRGR